MVEVSIHATSPFSTTASAAAWAGSCAPAAPAKARPASAAMAASARAVRRRVQPANGDGTEAASKVSERIGVDLPCADTDDLFDRRDEDLPVADLAGAGRGLHRLERLGEDLVGDRALDLQLGQEIDHVLGAAVQLGVALL